MSSPAHSVMRSAPRAGYDVGVKRQYRRNVWATFKRACPVPMSEASVFMLPSIEGDEIEVARASGVKENHIHVCDKNAAIVATLKRRHPLVTAHGIPALRTLTERSYRYHLINLDLCGVLDTGLRTFGAAMFTVAPGGCVAFTWLKGRDQAWTRYVAQSHESNLQRAEMAASVARAVAAVRLGSAVLIRNEQYVSGRVPMEWGVWKFIPSTIDKNVEPVTWAAWWLRMHVLLGGAKAIGTRPWIPAIPWLPAEQSRELLAKAYERLASSQWKEPKPC